MNDDVWVCPRCGTTNETWRNWCRSCSATQGEARAAQPPAWSPPPPPPTGPYGAAPPTPPPGAPGNDRVHPAVVALIVVAVIALGLGAFFLLGRKSDSKSSLQQQAEQAVLRLDDLPSEFSSDDSSSSSKSSDDAAEEQQADQCLTAASGLDPNAPDKDRVAKAKSSFAAESSSVSRTAVEGEVEFYDKTDQVVQQMRAISDPRVGQCVQDLFTSTFAKRSVDVSDFHFSAPDLDSLGDDRGGFEATFTITGPTRQSAEVRFIVAVAQKGKAFASVVITSINGDASESLPTDCLQAMLNRLS